MLSFKTVRQISLFLSVIIMISALSACGKSTEKTKDLSSKVKKTAESAAEITEEGDVTEGNGSDSSQKTASGKKKKTKIVKKKIIKKSGNTENTSAQDSNLNGSTSGTDSKNKTSAVSSVNKYAHYTYDPNEVIGKGTNSSKEQKSEKDDGSSQSSTQSKSQDTSSSTAPKLNQTLENCRNNWTLTFSDDFDGNKLDTKKWAYPPEWQRDLCVWSKTGVEVKDGNLYLNVIKNNRNLPNQPYDAGAIRTQGKFEQAYGMFEVRCKSPYISGINAAFWLMCQGANNKGAMVGGYDGAEIDILETYDIKHKKYQHAVHWDGYGSDHGCVEGGRESIINIYDGNYHTFSLLWTKDSYTFFVDDVKTWETTGGGVCQVPVYLKLTLGVGGSWIGSPDSNLIPTTGMVVDYVRVYKER